MKKAYWPVSLLAALVMLTSLAGCGGSPADKSLDSVLKQGVLRVAVPSEGSYAQQAAEQAQQLANQMGVACSLVPGDSREALLALCDSDQADVVLAGIPYSSPLDMTHTLSVSYQKENIFFVTKQDSYAYTKGMLQGETLGMDPAISPETSVELYTISEDINRMLNDDALITSAIFQGNMAGYFCYIDRAKALTKDGKLKAVSITNLPAEEHVLVMKKGALTLKEKLDSLITAQRMPVQSQPEQEDE